MRAKHSILTVLSLGFVLLATLATSAKAAQHVPLSQAAMRVGGILCAPGAALAAESTCWMPPYRRPSAARRPNTG